MSMIEKNTVQVASPVHEEAPVERRPFIGKMPILLLGCVAFLLLVLLSIAPLRRETGVDIQLHLPPTTILTLPGSWIPTDLGVTFNPAESQGISNSIESLVLTALEYGIYGLCVFAVSRLPARSSFSRITRVIWLGAILAGLLFVLAPATLSRDIFVYAGYGRIIATYHANPYFVPLTAFPHDPLLTLDEWRSALAAYGPLWLAICAGAALLFGIHPLQYVLGFRLLAFACHLLNIWLVGAILRRLECSPRTVALGMLLYAWNPLVLLESSLGGHNDIVMMTFILLGLLFSIRAEQHAFASPKYYLPAISALMLAALVKFTTLPLALFFLVMLFLRVLRPAATNAPQDRQPFQWRPALQRTIFAGLVGGLLALLFYVPFWIGHSLHTIVNSFSAPPSARFAENSILRAVSEWVNTHGLPPQGTWKYTLAHLFSQHPIWNDINLAALAIGLVAGAVWLWHHPTTRTIVLATLGTLGVLLIVTPWFFPWYVIWLVGLAAISLPVLHERFARSLVAFVLTLSASAFFTYYYNVHPPLGTWTGFGYLFTMIPALLAFCLFCFMGRSVQGR